MWVTCVSTNGLRLRKHLEESLAILHCWKITASWLMLKGKVSSSREVFVYLPTQYFSIYHRSLGSQERHCPCYLSNWLNLGPLDKSQNNANTELPHSKPADQA